MIQQLREGEEGKKRPSLYEKWLGERMKLAGIDPHDGDRIAKERLRAYEEMGRTQAFGVDHAVDPDPYDIDPADLIDLEEFGYRRGSSHDHRP